MSLKTTRTTAEIHQYSHMLPDIVITANNPADVTRLDEFVQELEGRGLDITRLGSRTPGNFQEIRITIPGPNHVALEIFFHFNIPGGTA